MVARDPKTIILRKGKEGNFEEGSQQCDMF